MVKVAALLLQLTLWAVTVHAFFPFIPDDHCDPDNHCGPFGRDSKRSEDGPTRTSEGITVDLVRRPSRVRVTAEPALSLWHGLSAPRATEC